jgi:hypothetical protein
VLDKGRAMPSADDPAAQPRRRLGGDKHGL